jgi:antitoxin MazE
MNTSLKKIGNSQGIILPASFLKELNIDSNTPLEMELAEDRIVIHKQEEPRKGWAEACKLAHDCGDDSLIIPDIFNDESFEEWQW